MIRMVGNYGMRARGIFHLFGLQDLFLKQQLAGTCKIRSPDDAWGAPLKA
jgi:hypothetical protein